MDVNAMNCASDKIPGVSSSQSSKNVKEGKFVIVTLSELGIFVQTSETGLILYHIS